MGPLPPLRPLPSVLIAGHVEKRTPSVLGTACVAILGAPVACLAVVGPVVRAMVPGPLGDALEIPTVPTKELPTIAVLDGTPLTSLRARKGVTDGP